MNRRNLLKSLIATTISGATMGTGLMSIPLSSAAGTTPGKKYPWKNWSGNQSCYPSNKLAPKTVAELQTLIASNKRSLRCVGSGHSFSALVPTSSDLLSTRLISGVKQVNPEKQQTTFYSGTTLSEIGPLLHQHDQALVNMPDIDQQTLAGAISTATHGTGRALGSLSSYIKEIEFIDAQGDLVQCHSQKQAELFEAAKVGLGSLGVITSITLQNTSAFKLKREAEWMSFEDVIENLDSLSSDNRNFEFFYFPFTGMCLTDRLNETNEPITRNEEIDGNSGIMDLKMARDYLSWSNRLREMILGSYMKTIGSHSSIDHSYAIYANERNVRFNEMEYHLPIELGTKALKEIRQLIETHFPEVFFPIEVRFVQNESAWLSPFYQRDCLSIAVHRYFNEDYRALFDAIEPIFQKYQGRPHWGKVNTFSAENALNAYPKWKDFLEVRKNVDPDGRFLNAYLKALFLET